MVLKPVVYWDGADWIAELDHISWQDWTPHHTWEQAMEHALWLGFCANGR